MKSWKISPAVYIAIIAFAFAMGFTQYEKTGDTVSWLPIEEAQKKSAEDGKPVFVFVEAEWCGICKRMIQHVFPDQRVSENLGENYYSVKIDLDSKNNIYFNGNKMSEREFAKKMSVTGTPTTLFFDSAGEELGRQVGFVGVDKLQRLLAYVASDRFFDVPFEEFGQEG